MGPKNLALDPESDGHEMETSIVVRIVNGGKMGIPLSYKGLQLANGKGFGVTAAGFRLS